ncbi:MAG: ethanolamine utilization protein EutN, partial [Deltaproteobacteria bacterium]
MIMGKVVGTVVASQKEPKIAGLKFLVVENVDPSGNPSGGFVVAADAVGAGVGEVVLYASGSSARQTSMTENRPIDAVIMAIVDLVELEG